MLRTFSLQSSAFLTRFFFRSLHDARRSMKIDLDERRMRMLCIIFSTIGWAWAAIVLAYLAGFHRGRCVQQRDSREMGSNKPS